MVLKPVKRSMKVNPKRRILTNLVVVSFILSGQKIWPTVLYPRRILILKVLLDSE